MESGDTFSTDLKNKNIYQIKSAEVLFEAIARTFHRFYSSGESLADDWVSPIGC